MNYVVSDSTEANEYMASIARAEIVDNALAELMLESGKYEVIEKADNRGPRHPLDEPNATDRTFTLLRSRGMVMNHFVIFEGVHFSKVFVLNEGLTNKQLDSFDELIRMVNNSTSAKLKVASAEA